MTRKTALLIAAVIVIFSSITAQAQNSRWGVVVGGNYNKIHFKQQDIFAVDKGFGATAGLMGEIMLPGVGFGFEGQFLYTMRSSKLHMGDRRVWESLGLGDERLLLHYIDVPLNLKFRYANLGGFESTMMPFVYAGPTFSFLAGHSKANDALKYTTMSVLLHAGIGVELFNRVQISGGYSFSIGQNL